MKIKTIVLYHRADFDGLFCREIARKFLPHAELIGWDYGDPIPNIPRHEDEDMVDGLLKYGGGGHRGACGFRTDQLPFLP